MLNRGQAYFLWFASRKQSMIPPWWLGRHVWSIRWKCDPLLPWQQYVYRPVARGVGGGGVGRPPQLPIPKILFHPLAILFHPLAILFHPLAILFHPLAILFHPLAILFHPLAILFHPWNVDDVTRAMSKGGCLWMSKRGVFFNFSEGGWRHADNVQGGGGCAWCSTHPSSDPPPPPGWLATGLCIVNYLIVTGFTCSLKPVLSDVPVLSIAVVTTVNDLIDQRVL